MLVHHIKNLENRALAKTMLDEQIKNSWPGLATEVSEMCKTTLIEDVKETEASQVK